MANIIICIEPSHRTNWPRYATAFTKVLRQLHTSKASSVVPDGIIAHLTKECGGSVHDRQVGVVRGRDVRDLR
jgi:hypothetical protein